jgi:DNA (cytosine-5)-methyltransferase 1
MSFPDKQDRPSRTITALCTRVSRESIVIRDNLNNLRRLTVRERASVQSFPVNYQFFGKTYANKIKMIGNAVPPLLTFYIAQSMQGIPVEALLSPQNVPVDRLELSPIRATDHIPDNEGARYSWNRTFWLAIKGLRFGSGVRFELKNQNNKKTKTTIWRVNFFYGNSKAILEKELDQYLLKKVFQATGLDENEAFLELFGRYQTFLLAVNEKDLQQNWTNMDRDVMNPIYLIDKLADFASELKFLLGQTYASSIDSFIKKEFEIEEEVKKADDKAKSQPKSKPKRNKLLEKGTYIVIGILIGASFNIVMKKEVFKMKKQRVRA